MTTPEIFAFSIFFCLIGFLGMLMVIQTIVTPLSFIMLVKAATSFNFKPIVEKDRATRLAFRSFISFTGSALLGSNGLTLFLAWMAFKQSNALAWWSLWYWPIMFAWQFIIYKRGTAIWYFQIVWMTLSIAALLLTKNIALP